MGSFAKKSRVSLDKHRGCEGLRCILELPENCIESIIGRVLDLTPQKPLSQAVRACKGFHRAWKGFLSSLESSDRIVAWSLCGKAEGAMSRLVRMGAACNPAVIASLASSDKTDHASSIKSAGPCVVGCSALAQRCSFGQLGTGDVNCSYTNIHAALQVGCRSFDHLWGSC